MSSPQIWPLALAGIAWLTIARAVLVFAHKVPPTCPRCWRRFERRHMGEPVCACDR
ncbi:MAG TPA: hypothetical protein VH306_10210 [Gaiellaceae bacterium]|jgi:hypothetical protein